MNLAERVSKYKESEITTELITTIEERFQIRISEGRQSDVWDLRADRY